VREMAELLKRKRQGRGRARREAEEGGKVSNGTTEESGRRDTPSSLLEALLLVEGDPLLPREEQPHKDMLKVLLILLEVQRPQLPREVLV
jgi:hypothetical protein